MTGQPTALRDLHLEQTTTMSLKREPACFAFLCSHSVSAPMPIDSLNLDLASADYFDGRASLWTTLEIRSSATEDRPTAVLGFDEAFLRPFTRALIEAATTRSAFRMTIAPASTRPGRHRVVEYVTGPGEPLREIILTPHETVIHVGAALGADGIEETLLQLPRSDSFLRGFAKMSFQADQMLRDTLTEFERIARNQAISAE